MTKGSSSERWYWLGAVVCGAVAVALGLWLVPQAKLGEVDPVSAVIALLALTAGLWSGRQAMRVARMTPVPVAEMAARLADEVRSREGRARTQLLGARNRTIDVDFAFRPAPAHSTQHARARGQLTEVVDYYRDLQPQRLVITGAPGAGKTVLALELLLGLLENPDPGQPVPVRIPATIWDTSHPLSDWLAQHLVTAYQQDLRTAQALVNAGLILPVIDGLDEVDADDTPGHTSRAADVVRALNAYQHGRHAAPLVLTCRTGHYKALTDAEVWTHDAALVTIAAVDSAKAREFIKSRVDNPARWQTVLSTIDDHPGGPLAVGLSTPWRLSLATTVYEQRNPDNSYTHNPADLIRVAATNNHAVREHLLAHFITATHSAQSDEQPPYTADQTHRWLAVLAGYLHRNASTDGRVLGGVSLSGTDLVLHQLWPLGGVNRVRGTVLVAAALMWLPVILLIHNKIKFGVVSVFGFAGVALLVSYASYAVWTDVWPEPSRFQTRQLRTPQGRQALVHLLVMATLAALALGYLIGFVVGFRPGLATGIAAGITLGLTLGLSEEVKRLPGHDTGSITWDPREIIKHDLAVGLVTGLAVGVVVGLTTERAVGLTVVLTAALTIMSAAWNLTGRVGVRYVVLLLCTRGWFGTPRLPWRLGRFLHWCYHAGLVRQAGIGYQFRHRELQDHLAHHPHPAQVSD